MLPENGGNDSACADSAGQIGLPDRLASDSDVTPGLIEFLRETGEYFDRAGTAGVYFYVARNAALYAWRFRGPPCNNNRHKLARALARFGHAALKAHRRGNSSLARQWWLDADARYKDLLLMSFASDLSGRRAEESERQRKIAQQPRKPGLEELKKEIIEVFESLVKERDHGEYPSNREVRSHIRQLAILNERRFQQDPDTGLIYFIVLATFRLEVTELRVKEALKGKRKKSPVPDISHG